MNSINQNDHNTASPYFGANVLETLTFGMYSDARDTLREYIQNAMDSLNEAERINLISNSEKCVKIHLNESSNSIVISDCGTGISSGTAFQTLLGVGDSGKNLGKDAGFRGIGRLAGIAYCKKLTFETTKMGEPTLSRLEIDCENIRKYFFSGSEKEKKSAESLLNESCTRSSEDALSEEHYFRVKLETLVGEGENFLMSNHIKEYLSQVAPVDFHSQKFVYKSKIEDYTSKSSFKVPTISLKICKLNKPEEEIFKPHVTQYTLKSGTTFDVNNLVFFSDSPRNRYWGWYGDTEFLGTITEDYCAGLRYRVNNIQVGDASNVRKLFEELAENDGRFNKWASGEIHINPSCVTPNGRRDGFEDSSNWRELQDDIRDEVIRKIRARIREMAGLRTNDPVKLMAEIEEQINKIYEKIDRGGFGKKEKSSQLVKLKKRKKKLILLSNNDKYKFNRQKAEILIEKCEHLEIELQDTNFATVVEIKKLLNRAQWQIFRIVNDVLDEFLEPQQYKSVITEIYDRLRPGRKES